LICFIYGDVFPDSVKGFVCIHHDIPQQLSILQQTAVHLISHPPRELQSSYWSSTNLWRHHYQLHSFMFCL